MRSILSEGDLVVVACADGNIVWLDRKTEAEVRRVKLDGDVPKARMSSDRTKLVCPHGKKWVASRCEAGA